MLLIAVTGPPGSGKTTLLAHLADWHLARGRSVDGFLAEAGPRRTPDTGAERYDLRWPGTGERMPFAERDSAQRPPYRFSEEAAARTAAWSRGLADQLPVSLLVLDEFGRIEAEGRGHMALWPSVEAAAPDVVVIAVRSGVEERIERQLGQAFDLRVDARDPDAWQRLRSACVEHDDWTRVGVFGAGAGGIEMTAGSALHGARVPLRGLALSSTQAVVMTYAGEGLGNRTRVVWVPFIAAGLKALSPAGNRLRPMLAITVQGLLFGGATRVLGWNGAGILAAGFLVGAWAAAQGLVLQYLLIGSDLLRAYDAGVGWIAERWAVSIPGIATVLGVWIALWGCTAAAVTWLAWRRRSLPARVQAMLERGAAGIRWRESPPAWRRAAALGLRDLTRPVFWAPVGLVAAIVLAAGSPWERAFWIGARAIALGWVIFSLARAFNPRAFIAWLRGRGHWGPAVAFSRALRPHAERREPR